MNTSTPLLVAGLLVCALFAPASFAAKPTPVFVAYAGVGYDTSYQILDDDYPVTMNLADGNGTFGQTSVATTVEFVIDFAMAPDCPSVDYVPFAVVDHDWAVVLTMPDLSQLFGHFNEGWLCMNPDTGHMVGEVRGDFDEGIGRFCRCDRQLCLAVPVLRAGFLHRPAVPRRIDRRHRGIAVTPGL